MLTIDQWYTISKWLVVVGPISLLTMTLFLSPDNRQRVGNRCLAIAGGGNPTSRTGKVWRVIVITVLLLSAVVSLIKLINSTNKETKPPNVVRTR